MSLINNELLSQVVHPQLEENKALAIKELTIFNNFFELKTSDLKNRRIDWYHPVSRENSIIEFNKFIGQLFVELELSDTDELLQEKIHTFSAFLKTSIVAFKVLSDTLFISDTWDDLLCSTLYNNTLFDSSRFLKKFFKAHAHHEEIRTYLAQYSDREAAANLRDMFREDAITEMASLVEKGYISAFNAFSSHLEGEKFIFEIKPRYNFSLENNLDVLNKVVAAIENKKILKNYSTIPCLENVANLENFQLRQNLLFKNQIDFSIKLESPLLSKIEELIAEIITKRAQTRVVPHLPDSELTPEVLENMRRMVLRDFDFFAERTYLQKDNSVCYYYGKHSTVFSLPEAPQWIFKIMKKEEAVASQQALDHAQAILNEEPSAFCHIPDGSIAGDLRNFYVLVIMKKARGLTDINEAKRATEEEFELIPLDPVMAEKWRAMTREGAIAIAKLGYWDVGFHNMLWDSEKGWSFIDFEQIEPTPAKIKEGLTRFIKMVPSQYIDEIYQVAAEHNVTL